MEVSEHLAFLDAEGKALVGAASRAALEAAVPGCPGWSVRDLLGHIGGIHRWASAIVAGGLARPVPLVDPPGDADLVEWVRQGHAALLDSLHKAPAD